MKAVGKRRRLAREKRKNQPWGEDPRTFEENSQGGDPKTPNRNSQGKDPRTFEENRQVKDPSTFEGGNNQVERW